MSPLSHFHYIPDGAITFLYESLMMSPLRIQNSIPERAISHMSGTELRIVSSRENEWKRLYSSAPRPQAPTVHQLSFRSCASGKPDAFTRQNDGHCVQQTWFQSHHTGWEPPVPFGLVANGALQIKQLTMKDGSDLFAQERPPAVRLQ